MEKAATDIYTFSELRLNGFTYVDKTAILKPLVDMSRGKQFFIARPRRFGKSLAISTLQCLFEGRRGLFKDLAIEPEWDWSRKWPVIRLDMGNMQYDTVAELSVAVRDYLGKEGERLGVGIDTSLPAPQVFRNLIHAVAATAETGQCVVLVDEYDKPLLGALNTPAAAVFKDFLKPFYGVIKYEEGKQRFSFITGVSKFSKVSIFSDLNNLEEMTLDASTATLFGYTHEEVRRNFPGLLAELGAANGMTSGEAFDEVVRWYDGYKFHPKAEPVINPVSLGLCFKKRAFESWWSKTAVPTFLIEFFKAHPLDISSPEVSDFDLDAFEPESVKPVTLLFQTGYLTIRDCERSELGARYRLGIPNREIEASFLQKLAALYVGTDDSGAVNFSSLARKTLLARDPEGFVEAFKDFFKSNPYDLTDRQNEQSWQAIMYVVLRIVGINVDGEVRTAKGRIDLTVETATDAYVIEVKRDSTPQKAIEQIRDKSYTDRFRLSGKPITLIGIAFSTRRRAVSGAKIVHDASSQAPSPRAGRPRPDTNHEPLTINH
jgi:hypothetical protein